MNNIKVCVFLRRRTSNTPNTEDIPQEKRCVVCLNGEKEVFLDLSIGHAGFVILTSISYYILSLFRMLSLKVPCRALNSAPAIF